MGPTTFGRHLRSLCKAAGIKQDALASELGVHQSTISRFMNDEACPKLDQVDRMAQIFGVSRWALIGGTALASEFPSDCIVSLDPEAKLKWVGYFASGLTGLSEAERQVLFNDAQVVREACESIRAYLYEPANYTDPVRNYDLAPERVYAIDHAQVSRSHFLVFHARYPSFGAGQELEIALNAGLPVVLLRPRGAAISRMVLGTYARLHEVHYATHDDLRRALEATFDVLVTDLMQRHQHDSTAAQMALSATVEQADTFGGRIKEIRTSMKASHASIARLIGVAPHAIEQLESGGYPNPSLTLLRRLAQVLRTSVSELVDGVPRRLEDYDPVLRRSQDALHQYANRCHIPIDQVQKLWDAYHLEYTTERKAVAAARTTALTEQDWETRHRAMKEGNGHAPRQGSLDFGDD
jgi:transcriptional regulator with XRE-family HTH domain